MKQTSYACTGIRFDCVRIKHFRCLRDIEVFLTPMTVLIGENNSGKTSFLDAVYAAIGSGPRHLGEEDVYLAPDEVKPPRDRTITVDIKIVPSDGIFPEGSPWLQLWGNGVAQDESGHDMAALRMTMSWDPIKGDYYVQRRFLREWKPDCREMLEARVAEQITQVTAAQTAPLALYFLDAQRDAAEEIKTRGSVWSRLVSHHGLSDDDIASIETQLSSLNESLVQKSDVLSHVQEHLHLVGDVIHCDKDDVTINPVARRLRDLTRGMDVAIATRGAPQFPLVRHGMGTRSLTSVLLFQALMAWRQKQQATESLHPFVAIEEPEAHLHPHAQRALFRLLMSLPGQKLVSTHSPYVCSQASIADFVHFFKDGHQTTVSRFSKPTDDALAAEDLRAINRHVLNTRGELLFSQCVLLFEGETEEQALPAFAELSWGKHPSELGVAFIGVGGSGNYLPFIRLATSFRIPWVVFSDGEAAAVEALNTALFKAGEPPADVNPRCCVIPDGKDFESYLVTPNRHAALCRMIASFACERSHDSNEKALAALREKCLRKSPQEVLHELKTSKTAYGARIAHALGDLPNEEDRVPAMVTRALSIALKGRGL